MLLFYNYAAIKNHISTDYITTWAKTQNVEQRQTVEHITEAEDIKKRWQEYTENCTKKIFMTQIIMMV